MEKVGFFKKNKSMIAFIGIEIVALVAFNFGNIGYIFGYAAAVMAVLSFITIVSLEEHKKNFLYLIPAVLILLMVSIIAGFGNFSKGFTTASNIATFVAIPSFFVLGYSLRRIDEIKAQTLMLIIGCAVAFLTLFGLFSTLIQYGFFYSLIYEVKDTPFYYYDGMTYDVTKEMSWLVGFEFKEVQIEYGSLFAFISALYLPGIIFIDKNKDKKSFRLALAIGIIGLVTLLLLPNLKALIVFVIVGDFALIYKFESDKPVVMKIIGFAFVGVVGLGTLLFLLCLIYKASGASSSFLDKLFVNNGLLRNSSDMLDYYYTKDKDMSKFFGIVPTKGNNEIVRLSLGLFEFQIIKELGVFGSLILLAFILGFGYFLYRYIRFGNDNVFTKVTLIMLLLGFVVYESFFNVVSPLVHTDAYEAFTRNPLFYISLFLMGYVFMQGFNNKKEGEKK